MIDIKARPLLVLFVLLFALAACDKVKGCGDKAAIPKTAEARVEQMTSKLSAKTDSAVVVADLEKMRSTFTTLKQRLPDTGVVESVQKQIQVQFGVDLLDEESWKRAGLAPNTSAVGAVYRSRLLLMLYVDNRQNFEKVMIEKAKAGFGIDAVTKTEKIGKHQMKVLSQDPAKQIAWLYDGKLAMVSMPATDALGALEDGSATLVLTEVAEMKKPESLWSAEGFQRFNGALVEKYPVALYLNPKSSLDSKAVQKEVAEDPNAKAATEWLQKNVTFLGAGLEASGDRAEVKAYMGLVPEIRKKVEEALKVPSKKDWSAYATDKVLLGARLSLDVQKTYDLLMESLSEDQRRSVRRNLKMTGDSFAVDIEKDVLGKLSGHVGLFFYGIAGNPLMLMRAQSPNDVAKQVGLMLVMNFKDAAAVDSLLAKIVSTAGGSVNVRPLSHLPDNEEFKVLTITGQESMGSFYLHQDIVIYATAAFGDEAMHKYMTGQRDDSKLAEMEGLDLGKQFATAEGFNGLYFYSKRAMENLGAALAMGGLGQILSALQEVALQVDSDDNGGFARLTLDLSPAPKTAEGDGATKGSDESEKSDNKPK